jgi:hypothetical protein
MRRRSIGGKTQPVAELTGLACVDDALERASHRRTFRREEAIELLRHVGGCVAEPEQAAAAASVVDDASVSFGGDRLIDRSRVVDALLDVRSVVRGGRDRRPQFDPADLEPDVAAVLASENQT